MMPERQKPLATPRNRMKMNGRADVAADGDADGRHQSMKKRRARLPRRPTQAQTLSPARPRPQKELLKKDRPKKERLRKTMWTVNVDRGAADGAVADHPVRNLKTRFQMKKMHSARWTTTTIQTGLKRRRLRRPTAIPMTMTKSGVPNVVVAVAVVHRRPSRIRRKRLTKSPPKARTKKTLTKPTTLKLPRKRIGPDAPDARGEVADRPAARMKFPTRLQNQMGPQNQMGLQTKPTWTTATWMMTTVATTNRRNRAFAVNVSRLRAGKTRSPSSWQRM